MHRTRAGLAAVALIAACATPSGLQRGALRVTVASADFSLNPTVVVPFTAVNTSAAVTYVAACGDRPIAATDRQQGLLWTQYSGGICPAVFLMAPLRVEPGDSLTGQVSLAEPGRYRLTLGVSATPGGPSEWSAVSNPFTIR